MRGITILALSLCLVLISGGAAIGGMIVGGSTSVGTIKCGGTVYSNTLPNGDTEIGHVNYSVRNTSGTNAVHINRLVVYGADGTIRCDAPAIDQPWGSVDLVVPPHNSFSFNTGLFASCHNPVTPTPVPGEILQVVIFWSNGRPGDLTANQVARIRNTTTDAMSFFALPCQ